MITELKTQDQPLKFYFDKDHLMEFNCTKIASNSSISSANETIFKNSNYNCISDLKHTIPFNQSVLNHSSTVFAVKIEYRNDRNSEENVTFHEKIFSFDASNNQFRAIPTSLFNSMPNLNRFAFAANQLHTLASHDFECCVGIVTMVFRNNRIKYLETGVFSTQSYLQYLDLQQNQIESIDKNLFLNNGNLRMLNLEGNPLKYFHFHIFTLPLATTILRYLPANRIETLDLNCTNASCSFEFDKSNHSKLIPSFNESEFENFWDLLKRIGQKLKILNLSNNFIGSLKRHFFEDFRDLRAIFLQNANITAIESETFDNQHKLARLDLSYNRLQNVSQIFKSRKFDSLTTLNLAHNQLTTIDSIVPDRFPNLISLGIQCNSFADGYLQKYTQNWKDRKAFELIGDSSTW